MDKTIVYYTSNGDYPALENAVRATIQRHSQGLPIISVSQQPIDFGENICVGDIGRSRHNIYKQLRLGAERAQSRFLVVCEADFLYPSPWFQFNPPQDDTYYYPSECYIIWKKKPLFFRKNMREFTGIVNREHLLRVLNALQAHDNEQTALYRFHLAKHMPSLTRSEEFEAGPVVTLKTDRQMHEKSPHSKHNYVERLPLWGTAHDVWSSVGL